METKRTVQRVIVTETYTDGKLQERKTIREVEGDPEPGWEEKMPDMPDTSGIFKFLDDFRNWFDKIPRMPKI